ncbi:MAG: pyridoxamine 5'-phosphate oxidase family protein [Flavobacteriaceae bacterium]
MLKALFNDSKKQLVSAIKHKKHPFRYFALTTLASDGSPHSRTVVLRDFDSDAMTLTIYTDFRSTKMKELANDPRAELLFYDSNQLLQLVLKAQLLNSEVSSSHFYQLPEQSKKDYSGKDQPGAIIKGPDKVQYDFEVPHFTLLKFQILQLEYLKLKRPNHLRALFEANDNWSGKFIAP